MYFNRLKLKKIATLCSGGFYSKAKTQKDVLSLHLDETNSKYYVLESVVGSNFKQYYAWEVKWQDICDYFNNRDNSKLIPKISKTANQQEISSNRIRIGTVYLINIFDGEILSIFQADETFLSKSLLMDSEDEWICDDQFTLNNLINLNK